MSLKPQVTAALKTVFDPEMPVNIYELGLIYDVKVDGEKVAIRMTLTGVSDVQVELTFDPPWTKDRMSEAAKLTLGIEDIIPISRLRR